MSALEDLFPPHKAGLFVEQDPHKANYETVEEWEIDRQSRGSLDWISPEQRALAVERQSFWTIQWYPETPIGFHHLSAADLEPLLAAARESAAS